MVLPLPEKWIEKKRKALEGLQKAIANKEVDEDILPILNIINSSDNYFTTSSCAGRILVLEKPPSESKPETNILGKWHREISIEEVKEAISKHKNMYLWFKLDSFILHIMARTIEDAILLVNLCKSLGLRSSGIRSVSTQGALVAIVGTENIEHLLGVNGKILVSEEELKELVNIANIKFRRMREKLKRLEKTLKSILQT